MPSREETCQVRWSLRRDPAARSVELDVRTNSLNLIRLVLALMVLVAHGFPLAGEGSGPGFRGENLGGWAVFGFFTISGYLITASRFANGFGTYLVHRVARIFPAFLVCLVLTAGLFAPVVWWTEHRSFDGFLSTGTSPVSYVLGNALLKITAYDVAGTPSSVPYPGAWNGSLWSLWYEFCCYLIVGALLCLPVVRRQRWVIAVAFGLSVVLWANLGALPEALATNPDVELLSRLVPPFLGGAVVQTVVHRVPLRRSGALVAATLAALSVWYIDRWGAQLAAPLIAYAILWLATVLPSPGLVRRHDVSYGAYIYAFPTQQLLASAGVHRRGVLLFDVLATVVTVAAATLSWRLVERPVMRWARRVSSRPGHDGRGPLRRASDDPPPLRAPESGRAPAT